MCADIADEQNAETAAALRIVGGHAEFIHTDVRRFSDLEAAVRRAEGVFGRLDIVIANAGTVGGDAVARPMEELSDEAWSSIIDVNLNGVFRTFKAALPALRRSGGGAMSATAAIDALTGVAGQSAYSASKGGVVSLVRSLAYQLALDQIRVNCVCPGPVRTQLLDDSDVSPRLAAQIQAEESRGRGSKPLAAMNRVAEADDIANAHLYLVCGDSRMVNGQAIVVDGGSSVANNWMVLQRR